MRYFAFLFLLFSSVSFAQCNADYDRSLFSHWAKTPGSEFSDIRQETIWLSVISYNGVKLGTVESGKVTAGLWYDYYTGKVYDLELVTPDMEHIIPLAAAFDRGANCWDYDTRKLFANDPDNLLPVHPSANRSKGKKSIYEYLPPNIPYCLNYLASIRHMVTKYDLQPNRLDLRAYPYMLKVCEKYKNGIDVKQISGLLLRLGLIQ